jgi:hypothetical protein
VGGTKQTHPAGVIQPTSSQPSGFTQHTGGPNQEATQPPTKKCGDPTGSKNKGLRKGTKAALELELASLRAQPAAAQSASQSTITSTPRLHKRARLDAPAEDSQPKALDELVDRDFNDSGEDDGIRQL